MPDTGLLTALASWTVTDSRNRGLKRWARFPSDVIDLTVAEMDFPTAEPIMQALRHSVSREAFGYPLTEEYTDFQAVTGMWLNQRGLPVPHENVFMLSDVMSGMVLAVEHFARPDAPVAVITPTYSAFFDAMQVAHREAIEVAMARTADGGYRLDFDAIEAAFRAGATALLLCNPSNPTGHVYSREELQELAVLAEKYDVRVISDEVHAPLRYGTVEHVPYGSLSPEAAAHSITLTSASKSWNIPGLRCAVIAFTNSADVPGWHALPGGAKGGISPLGIYASIAAFQDGQPWLDAALVLLERKRDLVVSTLNSLGYGELIHEPDSTYLGWLDLSQFRIDAADTFLRRQAKVAVTAGPEHGAAGAGFVRLNFATPDAQLHDFLERTEGALKGL